MNENTITLTEFKKIPLEKIMVTKPFTIGIDEPFSRVWDIFKLHRIRHLPVLDSKRIIKGIITHNDLYRIISPRKTIEGNLIYDKAELDRFILKHVMTKNVSVLSPDDTLGKIIELMATKKYGCIPIVDKSKYLIGIITQVDVLKFFAGMLSEKI